MSELGSIYRPVYIAWNADGKIIDVCEDEELADAKVEKAGGGHTSEHPVVVAEAGLLGVTG
jgi:hypothetical protein